MLLNVDLEERKKENNELKDKIYELQGKALLLKPNITIEKNSPMKRLYNNSSDLKQYSTMNKLMKFKKIDTRGNRGALNSYKNNVTITQRRSTSAFDSQRNKTINGVSNISKKVNLINNIKECNKSVGETNRLINKSLGQMYESFNQCTIDDKSKGCKMTDRNRVIKIIKHKLKCIKGIKDSINIKKTYQGIYRNRRYEHQKRASVSFAGNTKNLLNESLMKNYGL